LYHYATHSALVCPLSGSVTHPTDTFRIRNPSLQAFGYCDFLIGSKWIINLLVIHHIPKESWVQSYEMRPYSSRYFNEQKVVFSNYCGEGWENTSKITTPACFIL